MKERVHLREVGPRDGLQMVKVVLTTEQKIDLCRGVAAAGIREIEVTSFVPASVIPQFADAADVARQTAKLDIRVAALVPNLKGAQRAFDAGVDIVNFVLSASEAHNLANVRRSTADSLTDFEHLIDARDGVAGRNILVAGCIATAFGCTIQGAVSEKIVLGLADSLADAGADEIVVADTVGYADPGQVKRLMTAIVKAVSPLPVACHFHDTRGLGLANFVAALEAGVRAFDSSLGGLGGCPFAPGASGNISTEDTAFLLERLGFETGADIEKLIALRGTLERWLPDEKFAGAIARAGLPKTDLIGAAHVR